MKIKGSFKIWAAGLAIFSMFFGSGNLVFPLLLGQNAQNETFFGIVGLLLTDVLMPFLGVLAMILVNGDYQRFFGWLGRIPSLLICGSIIALIGPFGVLPRCLTIAHAGFKMYIPGFSLLSFSILACALIYFASLRKGRMMNILGYILTPLLLLSLAVIVVKGLFSMPPIEVGSMSSGQAFVLGLSEGYNMMDLLAAFFFSKTVLMYFKDSEGVHLSRTLKAGIIGMSLLGLTYIAFAFLGASFSTTLQGVAHEQLLMQIAYSVLGSFGGRVATLAIILACLTTAMALADVTVNFLVQDIFKGKLKKRTAMLLTLLISVFVSMFEFSGIAQFLGPILQICYPFFIVLTLINLVRFFLEWKRVKKNPLDFRDVA